MDIQWLCNSRLTAPITTTTFSSGHNSNFASLPFCATTFRKIPDKSTACTSTSLHAKKRNSSQPEPVLKPTIIEEVSLQGEDDEEEDFFIDDSLDGDDEDDEYFLEDDEDDQQLYVGDGGGGGGVRLAGTWWDKEALNIAEEVCESFDGELGMYAFKSLSNSAVQVRIERLTNKSGSPTIEDIEAFSTTYRRRLDEAELAKTIPNIALEVSSPGVERVVRIPEELDRFKDRNLYVKYVGETATEDSASESDGVFRLVTFDMETKCCTWGLADVRINREKAGKGRPLSKKQREWRLNTPFESLRLVRLYSEI